MSKAALYRLGILNLALYRLARDRKATQQKSFLLCCFAIAQQTQSTYVIPFGNSEPYTQVAAPYTYK